MVVTFMRAVQSRMHGLKKRNKSVMIEPDVKASGFFTSQEKLFCEVKNVPQRIRRNIIRLHSHEEELCRERPSSAREFLKRNSIIM